MRVLVTGGTGQIGGAVARALVERGDTVRCLVRSPERLGNLTGLEVEVVQGDVTQAPTVRAAADGVEAVVHAAGVVSYWAPKASFQHSVNVTGTQNVLDAAADAGARRLLLTSSIAALGHVAGTAHGNEDSPFNWGGMGLAYMETKHASQTMVLDDDRLETLAVLPGIAFGVGDWNNNGLRVLRGVASGRMRPTRGGATTAACLEDIVAGHLAALDRGVSKRAYILGGWTGSFHALFALAAQVVGAAEPAYISPGLVRAFAGAQELKAWLTGVEPPVTRALVQVAQMNRRYASDRAIAELGYEPQPLRVGMEAALEWARAQGRWP
ncbi:MAG: hypothetical protein CL927_13720 [Deltaproteobacteria bacterium]|nr:hypothetical protein [Deltaproteobacteria bacterium]HCH61262.1 hypothetical protein [Deltaproteobacteria bacterium]